MLDEPNIYWVCLILIDASRNVSQDIGIKNKGQSVILLQTHALPMGTKKTNLCRLVCSGLVWLLNYRCKNPDCNKSKCRNNGTQKIFDHINGVNRLQSARTYPNMRDNLRKHCLA